MNYFFLNLMMLVGTLQTVLSQPKAIHIAPNGSDSNDGSTPELAFKSFSAAMKIIAPGDTIVLRKDQGAYKEPLILSSRVAKVDGVTVQGNGATIDLGEDVTDGPWVESGSEWILDVTAPEHKRRFQASPIFVDNMPIWVRDERIEHAAGRGSVRVAGDGRFAVTFPAGKSPKNSKVFLTGEGNASGVQGLNVSNIVIRNLTVRLAGNDGFNFHGRCSGIVLEGVRAIMNGDQGISSHDRCEVAVKRAEVAFNGSRSGGIVDIGESNTSYDLLIVHHNRGGGFLFKDSGEHRVSNAVSFQNDGRQLPKESVNVSLINCLEIGSASEAAQVTDHWLRERLKAVAEIENTVPYPGVSVE